MQMEIPSSGYANGKKKKCCVRSDPRPRLTLVGVTAECHRDSRVLGGPIIPPLLYCLSSSLSFILKNYFFLSLSTSCPPSPSQAPCRPLTRTLCVSAKWTAFLAVVDHWDCPGLPLWSDGWACLSAQDRVYSGFRYFRVWLYRSLTYWAVICLSLSSLLWPAHRPWHLGVDGNGQRKTQRNMLFLRGRPQ